MQTVEMGTLLEMENLTLSHVFAMNQIQREGRPFLMKDPRPTNAFLWFSGCSGVFHVLDGTTVVAEQGSLAYIPQGAQYELEFSNCGAPPNTVLVEFRLLAPEEFVLSDRIRTVDVGANGARILALMKKMVSEYSLPVRPTLKLLRDMYGLLALVCESEKYRQFDSRSFETVRKGIEYLQKDGKQEYSVEEIARMCFITPAYFRRLFKEYTGISPGAYRIGRKMERAKEIMEHSNLSVGDLAALLGYDDPSYFCRVFKKEVGVSPSEYQKSIKKR